MSTESAPQPSRREPMEVLELVRERDDPDFDYAGELQLLEQLYRAELAPGGAA